MTKTLILPGVRMSGIATRGRPDAARLFPGMRLAGDSAGRRPPTLVARWSKNPSTGRLECRWECEGHAASQEDARRSIVLCLAA